MGERGDKRGKMTNWAMGAEVRAVKKDGKWVKARRGLGQGRAGQGRQGKKEGKDVK